MKSVLVTGAGGFIGRNLVSALLNDKNYELILTDKNDPRDHFSEISESENHRMSYHNLDITDRSSAFDIFKNHKIDTCIHLAALVNVQDSTKYPDKTMKVNVNGTINILDACSNNHVDNFVFASSAAVYGHPMTIPLTENHQLKPISPYGISKLLAENHVSSYMSSKKIRNTISLRIFNAYGDNQLGNESVITKFAKRLSLGLAPVIHGTGLQERDFVSVNDVVNAMLLSIKAMQDGTDRLEAASPLIFNIGTGVATTIKDLCEQMINLSGLDLKPSYKKGNDEADINASCADITKARKYLNFLPNTNLSVDLERIISSTAKTQNK
ncbi:MAG TPA: SDR family NAD(P)-dependent oxidoreductase [Nitrososphaeraceae archaeon]|nr:SDR family NAD(P)-dependent oxidoreductase [Nitrososphaeraceae archaeon]